MGFQLETNITVLTVFSQGLLSFFSPCILPLLPVYIGYLSGGTATQNEDGSIRYNKRKVMVNTLGFVIGISFAFLVLALGVSAAGQFFKDNQYLFARISGAIIILFGMYQLGVFGTSRRLSAEKRLPFRADKLAMSPFVAFAMGFTFSFAWTPCVGPVLTSVLLMTAASATLSKGLVLIGFYTLGFVLPFLAMGLFTTSVLEFFKKHRTAVKYTVKAGGILMIFMGIIIFSGMFNNFTGYISREDGTDPAIKSATESKANQQDSDVKDVGQAIDFTLLDQYGTEHTLSEYKGKTVFLNFWATWCPPCREEMPDIQKLHEYYEEHPEENVVILGIAAPNYGDEKSEEGIKKFLKEKGYTYPVVMDTSGKVFNSYGIMSYPTTYMIDAKGNVFGYVSGSLSEDAMKDIIKQTVEGK